MDPQQPRVWPDLITKPGKTLARPPPKKKSEDQEKDEKSSEEQNGTNSAAASAPAARPKPGIDRRAQALAMHKRLQDKWKPSKPCEQSNNCSKEDLEGHIIAIACDIIGRDGILLDENKNNYHSVGPRSLCADNLEIVHQIVEEIKSGRLQLDFDVETKGEKTRTYSTISQLTEVVTERLKMLRQQTKDSNNGEQMCSSYKQLPFKYEIVGLKDKGIRTFNEDYFVVVEDFNELLGLKDNAKPMIYCGLFDGHLGKQAAEYSTAHLHVNICRDSDFLTDIHKAIHNGFVKTDKTFNFISEMSEYKSGTTALCSFIQQDKIYVGNCGDSKAIICRKNEDGQQVISLSSSHHPDRDDEKLRVKNAGGQVVWYGTWRVNGLLAVSRSIGDRELSSMVIAEPEIMEHNLTPADQFLLLASDGLWDTMNEEHAVTFVNEHVRTKGRKDVCSALVSEAVSRSSKDNISVVIVFFDF